MDAPKRRSFQIRTKFGARQWRSRKNRPCDTCRQRKTACIIEKMPPCRFCRSRGLLCLSTDGIPGGTSRRPRGGVFDSRLERDGDSLSLSTSLPSASPADDPALVEGQSGYQPDSIAWPPTDTSPLGRLQTPNNISNITHGNLSHTLEDVEKRTAHSMGLAGEQDTDLLASFRAAIINESDGVSADIIQVKGRGSEETIPPVHFNLLHDEFQHADNLAKEEASRRIENWVQPYGPALVRLFFQYVHPVYCVVSKARFLQTYATDKLRLPASLRGAVYGLGAMFWKQDSSVSGPLPFDLHLLFEESQSSLQREFHAPDLWKLQACLLLLYERPADNATIETPRMWVFSAHAVACAQMIGLHREPTHWHIGTWEKQLRRKLWWATFATDIWSSICHGNPPHIYTSSFTTTAPEFSDLKFDEDVPVEFHHLVDESSRNFEISTSARFLEMIKLSQILHELIEHSYLDVCYETSMRDTVLRERQLLQIKDKLGFTTFMNQITNHCLHAFWGGHARSQLTLCGNFLIYLFLLAPSPNQVRTSFQLLESFHEALQRLRGWANDDASLSLLRPVALRMDSFFTQAANTMRGGIGPSLQGPE
ncbi:fungal-specific transcription factor domain-containing protein [Aspergillus ambiguus]|uniref:Zn(II)2Cys6 transcription factor n=1 Tax=Aspergillus ambiguus TaxID=176160 RepID=UPI003CCDAEE1